MSVFDAVFCDGGTQWVVLSAAAAKNRVKNAHGGPKRRLRMAHLVIQRLYLVDVPYTHATSLYVQAQDAADNRIIGPGAGAVLASSMSSW